MKLCVNASSLASDPEAADWLFESAAVEYAADPLEILLQREAEDEQDDLIWFARQYH